MRVLRKKPGCYFEGIDIPNTLEALQAEVGGYIEAVTLDAETVIICNEEGRLLGLEPNITINEYPFVGTILVVGVDGENFTDYPGGVYDKE